MRLRVLIFTGVISAALAAAEADQNPAFAGLRKDARLTKLLAEGDAEIKDHRYDEALKKVDEAAQIHPDDPAVLNARGAVLTELKRYDEAEKDIDSAIAADPKAFAPQFNRGEIMFLQKKYSDAALQFSELQASFGAIPLLKFKLYLCYALDNRKETARDALAQMRYPQDGVAWYFAYGVARLLEGKPREGQRLFAVANAIDPKETPTYRDTLRDADLLK